MTEDAGGSGNPNAVTVVATANNDKKIHLDRFICGIYRRQYAAVAMGRRRYIDFRIRFFDCRGTRGDLARISLRRIALK